jgi:hypothetical protein
MIRRTIRRLAILRADYCWVCAWWTRPECGHVTDAP